MIPGSLGNDVFAFGGTDWESLSWARARASYAILRGASSVPQVPHP